MVFHGSLGGGSLDFLKKKVAVPRKPEVSSLSLDLDPPAPSRRTAHSELSACQDASQILSGGFCYRVRGTLNRLPNQPFPCQPASSPPIPWSLSARGWQRRHPPNRPRLIRHDESIHRSLRGALHQAVHLDYDCVAA